MQVGFGSLCPVPLHSIAPAQRLHGCAVKCIGALIWLKDNFAKNKRKNDGRIGYISAGSVPDAVQCYPVES